MSRAEQLLEAWKSLNDIHEMFYPMGSRNIRASGPPPRPAGTQPQRVGVCNQTPNSPSFSWRYWGGVHSHGCLATPWQGLIYIQALDGWRNIYNTYFTIYLHYISPGIGIAPSWDVTRVPASNCWTVMIWQIFIRWEYLRGVWNLLVLPWT